MAMKTDLRQSMLDTEMRIAGASRTRDARRFTIDHFVRAMKAGGFQIHSVEQIKGKHLSAYVSFRRADNIEVGTLQTDLSHLRSILRKAGKDRLADEPLFSNKALGIAGRSRKGSKKAMSHGQFIELKKFAEEQRRPGFARLLDLQFYLGLRRLESIMADIHELKDWKRSLENNEAIHVTRGTKTGRPRYTNVVERLEALGAINAAIELAAVQGGFLVTQASGHKCEDLKQVESIVRAWMHRRKAQPHGARYRFAQVRLSAYLNAGDSRKVALRKTSMDLGHGDGRGRWVKSVYCQDMLGDDGPGNLEDLFD